MTSLKKNNSEFKFRPVGIVQTEIKDEDVGSTRKTSIKTIWIDRDLNLRSKESNNTLTFLYCSG